MCFSIPSLPLSPHSPVFTLSGHKCLIRCLVLHINGSGVLSVKELRERRGGCGGEGGGCFRLIQTPRTRRQSCTISASPQRKSLCAPSLHSTALHSASTRLQVDICFASEDFLCNFFPVRYTRRETVKEFGIWRRLSERQIFLFNHLEPCIGAPWC